MTDEEGLADYGADGEQLTVTTQIVLENQDGLEEALEEGDTVERKRWLQNYLTSLNVLVARGYRLGGGIDREIADQCRAQLNELLDE